MDLYKQACKVFPHHPLCSRLTTHKLRAKYIKCLYYLGDKWVLHHSKQVVKK